MAIVRANCPTCGDVETSSRNVSLQFCVSTMASSYAFQCPACRLMVSKPASKRAVTALEQAGVQVVYWDYPAELAESKAGVAISHDDLLSFHESLCRQGWLETCVAAELGA